MPLIKADRGHDEFGLGPAEFEMPEGRLWEREKCV